MNLSNDEITDIFFHLDEFCKKFELEANKAALNPQRSKYYKARQPKMSHSEVMTILVAFHLSGARCFKHYYIHYVQKHLQTLFPVTFSYNRLVEVQRQVFLPLAFFLNAKGKGQCNGLCFIDSTPIRVCKNKRIRNNKVFKGIAKVGKSTIGWFFGFKLHLIINELGEIVNFVFTKGNSDDRSPKVMESIVKGVFGKMYGDKGYISAKLFDWLFSNGVQLVTGIRRNMKNQLMSVYDKVMLRKRSLIETVNDELKNICQVEHSRHRSTANFLVNLVAGLTAYNFLPKKPSLNLKFDNQPTFAMSLIS